jgi:hypothetical protein
MKLKLTVIISGLLALIATMALTSTFPLAFAQEGIVAVVSKIMLENRTLNMIVVFLLAVIMG